VFVFAVVLDVVSCSQHSCIISRLGFINLKLGTLCLMFKKKKHVRCTISSELVSLQHKIASSPPVIIAKLVGHTKEDIMKK
jgi:hypothetical protein